MAEINDLPDEVLEFIINLLPPYKDVESCRLVCKRWANIGRNARIRKTINFQRAITESNLCWKEWQPPDSRAPRIAARYSHSAVVHKHTMYVFGGGSSEGTTFNDLWAFNLSTRTWARCNSHGNHPYPSPKACATMVCHDDHLVVFGGKRHPPTYPPYQRVTLLDELHLYNMRDEHWIYPKISTPWPPAMSAHSATVHGRHMVVFGGLQETPLNVALSNDVWSLDLDTYVWKLQKTSPSKPEPRTDHNQIYLDDEHLLIFGGLGGVNCPFTDMWLLTMISSVWTWREVPVRQKKWGPARMFQEPSCYVDGKLIILGQNLSLPKDLQITNHVRVNHQLQRTHSEPQNLRNPYQDPPHNVPPRQRLPDEPLLRLRIPRADYLGMMAFRDSCPAQEMRDRRLAVLQRREQELLVRRGIPQPLPKPPPRPKKPQNCEAVFICDLKCILATHEPYAEWLEVQNGGVLPGARVKTANATLVAGNGELIVFGGVEQNTKDSSHTSNNSMHFITVPHTII